MSWLEPVVAHLWGSAWAVIPVAIGAALICRMSWLRPVTRHFVWLVALVWFVVAGALPEPAAVRGLFSSGERGPSESVRAADAHARQGSGHAIAKSGHKSDGRRNEFPSEQQAEPKDELPVSPRVVAPSEPWRMVRLLLSPGSAGQRTQADGRPSPRDTSPPPALTSGFPAANSEKPDDTDDTPQPTRRDRAERLPIAQNRAGDADPVAALDSRPGDSELAARMSPREPAGQIASATRPERDSSGRSVSATPEAEERRPGPWAMWLALALGVRDLVVMLPAVPLDVWLAGLAIVMVLHGLRVWGFSRRLARGYAAPGWVQYEVKRIARRLGLRRVPDVVMVDDRVSPLIWCGWRVRLVLPIGLWRELDGPGRLAILCHELAHLRRMDHWVSRVELALAAVYWWHPVLWWVRRRLHEEADACCDAWVTWLMPRRRRAYAEAILRTRQYMDLGQTSAPAGGMAVASAGARQLARRLSMVMTQTIRPGHSLASAMLACVFIGAGWLVTPAISCPPEDGPQTALEPRKLVCTTGLVNRTIDGLRTVLALTADPAVAVAIEAEEACPPEECEQHAEAHAAAHAKAHAQAGQRAAQDAKRKTKEDIEREVRARAQTEAAKAPKAPKAPKPPKAPKAPKAPKPPKAPPPPEPVLAVPYGGTHAGAHPPQAAPGFSGPAPQQPSPPAGFDGSTYQFYMQNRAGAEGQPPVVTLVPTEIPDSGEVIVRTYRLPPGKAEALGALMIRNDVPVPVRPQPDGIEVHATARQHEVFERFIELIHPSGAAAERRRPGTRVVVPRAPQIEQQRALELDSRRRQIDAMRMQQMARSAEQSARVRALEAEAGAMEHAASQLEQKAHELEAKADELRARLEELEDDAPARRELERAAREVEREAARLMREAERMERRAEELERQSEALERDAEALERQMEQLERELEQSQEDVDSDTDADEERRRPGEGLRVAPGGPMTVWSLQQPSGVSNLSTTLNRFAGRIQPVDLFSSTRAAHQAAETALREAAEALRAGGMQQTHELLAELNNDMSEAVREAMKQAGREVHPELVAQLREALEQVSGALGHATSEAVREALEEAAAQLERAAEQLQAERN